MFKTALINIAHQVLRVYWLICKPVTIGARGVIISKDQKQVFLVKHTTSNQWYLPGGGVKKSEAPAVALQRELREEIGIQVELEQLKARSVHQNMQEGKKDTVHVFLVSLLEQDIEQTPNAEIEKGSWHPLNQLPSTTSPGTRRRIEEFLGEKSIDANW